MYPAKDMLPFSRAVAWSALAAPTVVWSDAARVLMSAEMTAAMPTGPIFGPAISQREERAC